MAAGRPPKTDQDTKPPFEIPDHLGLAKKEKNMTPKPDALAAIKNRLFSRFPDDVERVILYGSRAAGTADPHSDYDILVVLKRRYDWRLKNRIYDETWEVDRAHDILTDIRLISRDELDTIKGFQPFVRDALERGIEL